MNYTIHLNGNSTFKYNKVECERYDVSEFGIHYYIGDKMGFIPMVNLYYIQAITEKEN